MELPLDMRLGDPFQATLAKDPETAELVPMGKLRSDAEHNRLLQDCFVSVCSLFFLSSFFSPLPRPSLSSSPSLNIKMYSNITITSLHENNCGWALMPNTASRVCVWILEVKWRYCLSSVLSPLASPGAYKWEDTWRDFDEKLWKLTDLPQYMLRAELGHTLSSEPLDTDNGIWDLKPLWTWMLIASVTQSNIHFNVKSLEASCCIT